MHNLLRSYKSCVNNNVAPNRCKFVYFSDIKAIFNNNEYYIDSYKEYEQVDDNLNLNWKKLKFNKF